jgi:hypothetical protein
MKKIFTILCVLILTGMASRAQAPRLFNYQGVARNAVGNVLGNKNISLRLTIREGGLNGLAVYSETRAVTTNSFGLFVVQVGSNGATAVLGSIGAVQWHTGSKFLQVEIDPDGGNAFLQIGITELLSVPYALYSESGLPIGPAGQDLAGAYPNPTVARLRGVNISTTAPTANYVLGFDGTNWTPTNLATHPGNYWRLNGADLINTNTGYTGIGTTNPGYKLEVKTAVDGYVAAFENTNDGTGDGLLIKLGKTHPRWTGNDYVNVPLPGVQGFENQVNQVRDWIYGNDTFSPGDLINLAPHSYIAGTVCNLTNLISEKLNEAMNLPIRIGPYSTPSFTVIPRTEIFGGVELPALPDIPSISIGPYSIPSFQVIPRMTILPEIPKIPCTNLPSLSLPVLSFTSVDNSLSKDNEFVVFADKDGRKLGSIRAQSIENFSYDYFDGLKILNLTEQMVGLDLVDDAMGVALTAAEMAQAYNNIGVEYSSGNGDYAEWLERIDPTESISTGDIIGVRGGRITKNLENAEQIMAVSHRPIVLGNMPEKDKLHLGNNIAFMGQIPVKIMGAVQIGDYIVAKSEVPGYGVAIPAKQMTTEDFRRAVGRAWETKAGEGPKMVNTVVGVHNNDFLRIIDNMQKKMDNNDQRLKAIEEKLNLQPTSSSPNKKGF